jgi:hypothetical protein
MPVPLRGTSRRAAALLAATCSMVFPAPGSSAERNACELPAYVSPIRDIRNVLDACMKEEDQSRASGLPAVRSLVRGWNCDGLYKASKPRIEALNCLADKSGASEALFDRAMQMGELLQRSERTDAQCAEARAMLERASDVGNGEAAEALFMIAVQGSYRGICGPSDAATAARYLEKAAADGSARAQARLALILLSRIEPLAPALMDDPDAAQYKVLVQFLGSPSIESGTDDVLALLEKAAQNSDPLAMWALTRIYGLGVVGERRVDRALAWAAARSPTDDAVGDESDFAQIYRIASPADRTQACALIRDWSVSNMNLRFVAGEIANRFFADCAGAPAVVLDRGCLNRRDLLKVDSYLKPLLASAPECAVTTAARK